MPRTISDAHKAALAAGRAAGAAERAKQRERDQVRFRTWSREDARLTGEIIAVELDGGDASELRTERIALCHEMGKIPEFETEGG